MKRESSKQDRDIQAFFVHGFELGDRIVTACQRLRVAVRDFALAGRTFGGILFGRSRRERLSAGGADGPAVGESKLDLSMRLSRLTARDPVAPLGIHVLQIEIVRLEYMHVAIENFVTIFSHLLSSPVIWVMPRFSRCAG